MAGAVLTAIFTQFKGDLLARRPSTFFVLSRGDGSLALPCPGLFPLSPVALLSARRCDRFAQSCA